MPLSPDLWYYQEALERVTGSGSPVLVVDDDDGCRALIVELLLRIDCTVYEASGGDDALDVARTVRPALVILDVDLPRGVTGYEVCRELRDTLRRRPLQSSLFVSGARAKRHSTEIAGFLIGADDYVFEAVQPRGVARTVLVRSCADAPAQALRPPLRIEMPVRPRC